jgi:CheY-like chemotaxis protein/anti-sigma regulatory factor (Ser/Thr protein kinase)
MSRAAKHVLVVEDSATQRAQMQFLLEEAGYRVSVAANGQAGLDMVRSDNPSLVVTDLIMPEMDGLELVDAVKGQLPELPVVLTTAQGSEDIAAEALRRGAASYVPKRSVELDLVSTVQRLLALVSAARSDSELVKFLTSNDLSYQLTNDDALIPRVIGQLQELLRQMEICGERELIQISTALDEALVNATIHGNLEVSSKLREVDNGREYRRLAIERRQQTPYAQRSVFVSAQLSRARAVFIIRDEGPGFDPSKLPDPTDPANIEKPSGRGLLLINAFLDRVSHNEVGNEITLVKERTP